jgi:choline transporter-like protein 2/4/5
MALLLRNSAKTLAVTYVADFALCFAKFVVVGLNTIGAYGFLAYNSTAFANPIYEPLVTVVLIGVETYIIASLFFANYVLAIDTIFLSALEDLDKNDGSVARPYYMRDELKKIMRKHNTEGDKNGRVDQL